MFHNQRNNHLYNPQLIKAIYLIIQDKTNLMYHVVNRITNLKKMKIHKCFTKMMIKKKINMQKNL